MDGFDYDVALTAVDTYVPGFWDTWETASTTSPEEHEDAPSAPSDDSIEHPQVFELNEAYYNMMINPTEEELANGALNLWSSDPENPEHEEVEVAVAALELWEGESEPVLEPAGTSSKALFHGLSNPRATPASTRLPRLILPQTKRKQNST